MTPLRGRYGSGLRAAGAQGSAIVRALLTAGERVRILLREGRANPFGTQVEIVRGDLADPATLRLASLGVGKVVLTLPQVADRALAAQFGRNAIAAAKAAGVKLLVWNAAAPCRRRIPAWPSSTPPSIRRALSGPRGTGDHRPSDALMENLIASWSAPGSCITASSPIRCRRFPGVLDRRERLAAFVAAALMRPDLPAGPSTSAGRKCSEDPRSPRSSRPPIGRRVDYVPVPLSYFAAGLNAAPGGKNRRSDRGFLRVGPAAGRLSARRRSRTCPRRAPGQADRPFRLGEGAGLDRAGVKRKGGLTMAKLTDIDIAAVDVLRDNAGADRLGAIPVAAPDEITAPRARSTGRSGRRRGFLARRGHRPLVCQGRQLRPAVPRTLPVLARSGRARRTRALAGVGNRSAWRWSCCWTSSHAIPSAARPACTPPTRWRVG